MLQGVWPRRVPASGLKRMVTGVALRSMVRPWILTSCQVWSLERGREGDAVGCVSTEEAQAVKKNTMTSDKSVLRMFFTAFVDKIFGCKDTKYF